MYRKSNEYCTISVCVFVALVTQYALRMGHIVTCERLRSAIHFHIISETVRFSGKETYGTQNVCFDFLYKCRLKRREENQLDVTECFIALMIRSTCFGHFYAHHQELETICVLLPPMVCSAWLSVVGGQV